LGRTCTVCACEDRVEIDRRLIGGTPVHVLARETGLSIDALGRHKVKHLAAAIAEVERAHVEARERHEATEPVDAETRRRMGLLARLDERDGVTWHELNRARAELPVSQIE
jgi:hypothetical protein